MKRALAVAILVVNVISTGRPAHPDDGNVAGWPCSRMPRFRKACIQVDRYMSLELA